MGSVLWAPATAGRKKSGGSACLKSIDQSEASQVGFCPASLGFDDASERSKREGVRGMMEGESDAATVGVPVVTVATFLPVELKAVIVKRGSKTPGGRRAEARIIDAHTITATTGSFTSVTPGGNGSPSSIIDSITICATSRMFPSASSFVLPHVAPPFSSRSGI